MQPTGVYRAAHGFVWFRGQAVSAPGNVSVVPASAKGYINPLNYWSFIFQKFDCQGKTGYNGEKFNITLTEELEGYCEYCYS